MTIQRLYATASLVAAALLVAGCGGGGEPMAETPPPATPTPAPAPAMSVDLPEGHGISEAGEHMIMAGMTMKVAGVRFSCPGDMDCTVIVTEGGASATYSGGEPTVALLDAAGYQAFMNLSGALLDADQSADLKANLYHDVIDVQADANADPVVEAADNGGGVTTSLTTHEEPDAIDDDAPLTGVSDIFVSVDPEVMRGDDEHATAVVQVVDETTNDDEDLTDDITDVTMYDQVRDPSTVMNPVLVDADGMVISDRTSNFVADADWDLNPAAEWTTDPALMGATQNMDVDENDIWTNYFQVEQDLAGGRTLQLDLRSDFNPNAMALGAALPIARGPDSDGTDAEVRVDWSDITGITIPLGGEINLAEDDADTMDMVEGMDGSYMGVKGRFSCVDDTTNEDGQGICRINHHENGMMSVSEDDTVVFRPYSYSPDADWLAAGVWLTIPDDTEDGDYAIGAFVFGNNPYKADTAANAQGIEGTATYAGEAFGRYAENDAGNMETGRFTADAMLMADFGDDSAMGTIHGDLTDFMANGQSEDWDVNFEQAMIQMGMEPDNQDPPVLQTVENSALRFNAGASGHARGHGLTGFWNGQFYGGSADGTDQPQPGSAAGTFGLTSERDDEDDYSLILGGAFATHLEEEE